VYCLVPIFAFNLIAVSTDSRKSDITDLQLSRVDFRPQTITVVENKTGDTKTLKMNDFLTECLKSIKRPKGCQWLFNDWKGNKVRNFRKSWKPPLKRRGITVKIRFHDLKNYAVMAGNGRFKTI
jgi:integrase